MPRLANELRKVRCQWAEFPIFAGVPCPARAGSIPATFTKVSESPDCENFSLEEAFGAVLTAFHLLQLRPTFIAFTDLQNTIQKGDTNDADN